MKKLSKRDILALASSTGDASNRDLSGVNLTNMELIGFTSVTGSLQMGDLTG